jgi:hypothetical protein
MASWIPLTLGRAFLEPMEVASSHLLTVVDLFANLLIVLGQVLEIIGILIAGFFNALAMAINALLTAIKNFLNDLLATGFYVFPYAPLTKQTAVRFSEWLEVAASSLDKKGDKNQPEYDPPKFSNDAYVGALVTLLAFPTFEEIVDWWNAFLALWSDWSLGDIPSTSETPADNLNGEVPNPHWYSKKIKDYKPIAEMLQAWISALDKFTQLDAINDVIQQFAEMLKRKGKQLKDFAEYTRRTILNLIEAISQTGVWVLPVYGRGGNELVKSALRNVTGEPSSIKSSAQEGAENAVSQLRQTISEIGAVQPEDIFVAPQNNLGDIGASQQIQDDLNDHLDKLEDDIRKNPQGRLTTLIDNALMSDEQRKEFEARKDAGYPDSLTYFEVVPGYTDSADKPPITISTVYSFATTEQVQEFLDSLTNDQTYGLTNPNTKQPPENVPLKELPFSVGYKITTQSIVVVQNGKAQKIDVDIAGIYAQGYYTDSVVHNADMLIALEAVKKEIKPGGILIVDLQNIVFNYETTVHTDMTNIIKSFINDQFYSKLSNIIFVASDPLITVEFDSLSAELEAKKNSLGGVSPGLVGSGDGISQVAPSISGSANDVGTRTPGEALGVALSDALPPGQEEASVPIAKVTYDEEGNAIVEYEGRKNLGSRFAPTEYPDFAGMNNWTIGAIFLAGGPSEAPAEALFNLFGIATAAGETAGMGAAKTAETVATGASVFNNFPENYQYTQAKEREAGNTVNFP